MSKKFKIGAHTTVDKSFFIFNDDISLLVDFDDVDHKTVNEEARRIVEILNGYDALKARHDDLKFRMDGLEK